MKIVITLIICSTISFCFWNSEKQQRIRAENKQNVTNTAQASSSAAVRNTSEHENIVRTLQFVAENWEKTDVNRDGRNNCIDAAVLFYQYYPDKSKVCIEINVNQKTGLNHLFNCVFTEGVWKAIEPLSYATNHSNYLMWAVWGNQYDNKYNRDVTSDYIIYVRK